VSASLLPIDEILPELLQTIRTHSNCVLQAPPGAGKTTRVPLALLEQIPASSGKILMLEPRRLAAVSAARWMSRTLNEEVGQTVGYSIRFDSCAGSNTRIEVITEGILTRRIQNDPLLEGVAMVIFDEFHERSIHADLGLALCLDVQRQVRHDLKILVMSATLEGEPLARLMDGAPVVSSAGRSFPVQDFYLDDQPRAPLPARVVAATLRALAETEGDILLFLPGAGEIRSCASRLSEAGLGQRGFSLHLLYGDLPFERQQAAIQPSSQRKVVLATSIAETSLTIEGVRTVIDCGLSRRLRHDQGSGMNRLVTVRESKASAEQRRGRAGRLASGVCYRLFSRHTFNAMTPQTPPEIMESDLSPLLLELAAWGIGDPSALSWLDPPPAPALVAARQLLTQLSALDAAGLITPLGHTMARLPLHPRLSCLLLKAQVSGCQHLGSDLAALLSERDIILRTSGGNSATTLSERLDLLLEWRMSGRCGEQADLQALKSVERVSRQLKRLLRVTSTSTTMPDVDSVSRLLLAAYPDRVARLREGDSDARYLLSNGRGARMASAVAISRSQLLIALSVSGSDQGEGIIHLAEAVTEEALRTELKNRIERRDEIVWDAREGRISAVRGEYVGAVCLSSAAFTPKAEALLPVVMEALREHEPGLLSWDEPFTQIQARIQLLRRLLPDDGWPDVSDTALLDSMESWLAPFLGGVRNARQLAAVNCASALLAQLDYRQRMALDDLAPTHLLVPSGSRIRVDYCAGEWPVLAVKLQELFGLAESPKIARGRVALLLHLLSPGGRPLQVTMDLKGFWDGSYHQVKKEMKGRYPKHPWPDDPWSAQPTRRAKPRGT